jgi:hypothetical protein
MASIIIIFTAIILIFYNFLNENLISFPNGDAFAHVWSLWINRLNYLEGLPSTYITYSGYPFGSKIMSSGPLFNSPIFQSISLILVRFFNEVFTFNFINLLYYPLSIIFAYLLIKYFTNDFFSAVLAL